MWELIAKLQDVVYDLEKKLTTIEAKMDQNTQVFKKLYRICLDMRPDLDENSDSSN